MRLSKNFLVRAPVYGFIFYFRGTPLLVQLFLVYYGSGQFRPELEALGLWTFFREAYFCAVFTLTLNTAAYTAEILRGAIQAVPYGEIEAARAMGMSRSLLYRRIILPKAFRIALPAYSNEVVFLFQATSLVSIITLLDLTGVARVLVARTFAVYELYIAAAHLSRSAPISSSGSSAGWSSGYSPTFGDPKPKKQRNLPELPFPELSLFGRLCSLCAST